MRARTQRKSFADYFSPADFAHVNWLSGNARTVLTGDGNGRGRLDEPMQGRLNRSYLLSDSARDISKAAAPDIAGAIDEWYAARRANDIDMVSHAADKLVSATAWFQGRQDVRPMERAPLPEPLVEAEAHRIQTALPQERPTLLRTLLEGFAEDTKGAVLRQLSSHLPQSILRTGVPDDARNVRRNEALAVDIARPTARSDNEAWEVRPPGVAPHQRAFGQREYSPLSAPRSEPGQPDWQKYPAPPPPARQGCKANARMVTCRPPGGLPPISFPRPPGWSDDYFDDTEWEHHEYKVVTEDDYIPPPGEEEAYRERLFQELLNDPTPGDDSPASASGQRNDVGPLGPLSPFGKFWGGQPNYVKSYVIEKDGRKFVVNVTEGTHYLSPGYVVRTVVRLANGRFAILTFGSGVDWKQADWHPGGQYGKWKVEEVWGENSRGIFKRARTPRSGTSSR